MQKVLKSACKQVLALAAVAGLVLALAGCVAGPQQAATGENANANSQYMAQVNQAVEELSTKLGAFDDAVSRNDVVSMRTQADGAFAALDKLNQLQPPEALKEVQEYYSDGCASLKEALSGYVDLYTEIDSATDQQPFDYSTYEQRLSSIQSAYDTGLQALRAGDQKVTELRSDQ
ncbi:hypothetical protein [Parvibacter caecicola]|uniref:hypothetical protein n=1 Tax=Parvibacter caecicola TaxID=747645 RepID=UPI002499BBF5|nr:hypothetical protein [Parvibacter caecicola]